MAGTMLEVATGNTFEQLMMEVRSSSSHRVKYSVQELFEPLGMTGCGFGPTTESPELPPLQPWGGKKRGKS